MKITTLHNNLLILLILLSLKISAQRKTEQEIICNPLNLNYRYQLDLPSRREAADPSLVLFKDKYYLFASKSGGYWVSDNLMKWSFITTADLPVEDYAPTALVMNNAMYFMALDRRIYKSNDPMTGHWKVVKDSFDMYAGDPCLFLDDDGRLYLYHGVTNSKPIRGIELDKQTFNPIGVEKNLIIGNPKTYGWERTGNFNTETKKPFLEGAWMTKHNGRYYLQYATPGTQYKSYSDGLYIAESPLGPFKVAENNPFSYKPEGFICSAGHGSTFQDKFGNYWHITSMLIGINHRFERRLGMFPAFFDNDQIFYTYTGFGDFPHRIPTKKLVSPDDYRPTGMLLSYKKPVEVSSALEKQPKENATNENIQDYWSAQTGNKGEWLMIDLQQKCNLSSVQINFAEEATNLLGRSPSIYYQYLVEFSIDKINWEILIDKRLNKTDFCHDFIDLAKPVTARYVRITNYHVPDGKFAISGFRIFGKGSGKPSPQVTSVKVLREDTDKRNVKLTWTGNTNTTGYNIRYGTQPNKLYLNYQTFNSDSLTIHSLNSQLKYYFTIDSFNENGITKGEKIVSAD